MLFYANSVIAVLAALPTLLVLLFTIEAFTKQPGGCTDCWDFGYSNEERLFFLASSVLLIFFYRYVFINPFMSSRQITFSSCQKYFAWNILVNGLTIAFFIYVLRDSFFSPFSGGIWWLGLMIYMPVIPITIASAGIVQSKQAYDLST